MNNGGEGGPWVGDEPLTRRSDDRLGRFDFANEAAETIRRLTIRGDSSVIALIGPWGAGKSTVLEYIQANLKSSNEGKAWAVVAFNPWFYQDLTSLQNGFFQAIHAALPVDGRKGARDKLASFAETIAPYAGLLSFTGIDPSAAVAATGKALRGSTSVGDMHAQADKALRSAGQPLLVVLDDLDRLDPPELLLVLKLIRLAGRLSNVHYLISFDERTLLDVLSRTGLVGSDDPRRGIEYLEKIVQLRLDLPPMRDQQISDWVDEGLAALEGRHGLTVSDDDSGRFARAYLRHLRSRLNTPRAIKRYFTQVDSTINAMKGEVNTADLLLVTWLRSAEPVLYHALSRARTRLIGEGGVAEAVARMVGQEDVAEDREYWARELAAAKVRDEDASGVAEIVGELFPRFQHAWFKTSLDASRLAEPGRISHRDYFDRYFAFAVPLEDISDALVGEAYGQLIDQQVGTALSQLNAELPGKSSLILAKLDSAYHARPEGGAALLAWVRDNIHGIPDVDALLPPLKIAEALGQAIYESLTPAERLTIVRGAGTDVAKLSFVASLVVRASTRKTSDERVDETQDLASVELTRLVIEHLTGLGRLNPLRYDYSTSRLIWDLRWIDPDAVRSWVEVHATTGSWPLLDFAARLVTTREGDGRPSERIITGVETDAIDAMVGIDALLVEMAADPSATADSPRPFDRWEKIPATDENRRAVVRSRIAEERVRREVPSPEDSS